MIYQGSCHCGKIAFEAEGDIQSVMECNCSICRRRGHLLWFIPRAKLYLKTPEKNLGTYMFNKKVIQHHFCPTCGCGPYGEGTDPKSKTVMAAVNVRCLEGVEPSKLKIVPFDGRSI